MLDYQRIVDDVRSSLYSHSAEGMDFLRAAAADYSVACDEINERLRQCGSLLRKGLRSEAIQLNEIDPNALDVVAIFDFPERDQWIELSKRNGLAPPTPLMLDVAADLNEAYAIEQPLAALLQHHRLLALAHGPLSARIQVLRRLAEMDANNPVWQEDLRMFEQERQKQIQAEVEAAARASDTAALASLDAELSSPEWKNLPPPALAKVGCRSEDDVALLGDAIAIGGIGRGVDFCHVQWPARPRRDALHPLERDDRQLRLAAPRATRRACRAGPDVGPRTFGARSGSNGAVSARSSMTSNRPLGCSELHSSCGQVRQAADRLGRALPLSACRSGASGPASFGG